jgi:chromosome segregation ATPase
MSFVSSEYPQIDDYILNDLKIEPEDYNSFNDFLNAINAEFDKNVSSGVFDSANAIWQSREGLEELREEQTQEELSQDYYDETDEIEETIEQAEQDIERKEQEIEDLEEQIRFGILSLEAEPISKPKRKQKGIIQKVVGFFRGLFR